MGIISALQLFSLVRRRTPDFTASYLKTMSRKIHSSRVEGVDKNVWVEFTQLAADYKAVNLGQGFPDFSPPKFIQEAFCSAVMGGPEMHQYTRAFGHPHLVKSLATFFTRIVGHEIDPLEDILVTVGAYQALFCAFQALVDEGDEVIIVEPFFDCYQPMVRMAGGKAVYVPLRPRSENKAVLSSADWVLSSEELASKITPRTKAIVINTPNNPLGKVYKKEELQEIADVCIKNDLLCISDEVYEWLTYDGAKHVKIASLPGMWERTITVGSAGKTFSATGWKEAVACGFDREYEVFGTPESYFQQLPAMLHDKRKKLSTCLESVGLKPILPEGGYFMVADISTLDLDLKDQGSKEEEYDFKFVKWLIREKGLATIPVSAFYSPEHQKDFNKYIRFCFVKEDSTLDAAVEILRKWRRTTAYTWLPCPSEGGPRPTPGSHVHLRGPRPTPGSHVHLRRPRPTPSSHVHLRADHGLHPLPCPSEETTAYTQLPCPSEGTTAYTWLPCPSEGTTAYTWLPCPSEGTTAYTWLPCPSEGTTAYTWLPCPSEGTTAYTRRTTAYTRLPCPSEGTTAYTWLPCPSEGTTAYTWLPCPSEETTAYTQLPCPSEGTTAYTQLPCPSEGTTAYTQLPCPSEGTTAYTWLPCPSEGGPRPTPSSHIHLRVDYGMGDDP
uniref:Aminotransferase class I/classII large domain-containing protein n=1 Tax=Knipowitschia caucasica TaxID=637954 RepID=A0AAV2IVN3_KNICA